MVTGNRAVPHTHAYDPRDFRPMAVTVDLEPSGPLAGTDAAAAQFRPVTEAASLAFDHDRILRDAVDRARAKLEYTSLATTQRATGRGWAELYTRGTVARLHPAILRPDRAT